MRYLTDQIVKKSVGNRRIKVIRDPAPETLLGDSHATVKFISALRFAHKYSSMTLSFSNEEIEVFAFNRGERRGVVESILATVLDAAYAGIPHGNVPPIYINTHTHSGRDVNSKRLELNILMPRAVTDGQGRLKSFNPFPPQSGYRVFGYVVQEALIQRHRLFDPKCPLKTRMLKLPSWMHKERAEAMRGAEPIHALFGAIEPLIAAAERGEVSGREDLVDRLQPDLHHAGYELYAATQSSVTIQEMETEKLISIRGFCFTEAFLGPQEIRDLRHETGPKLEERRRRLEMAPTEFVALRNRYAADRAERYGHPPPPLISDLSEINPLLLPIAHPDSGELYDDRIPLHDGADLALPVGGPAPAHGRHAASAGNPYSASAEQGSGAAHLGLGAKRSVSDEGDGVPWLVRIARQLTPVLMRTIARIQRIRRTKAVCSGLEAHASGVLPHLTSIINQLEDSHDQYRHALDGYQRHAKADRSRPDQPSDAGGFAARAAAGPRSAADFRRDQGIPDRDPEDRKAPLTLRQPTLRGGQSLDGKNASLGKPAAPRTETGSGRSPGAYGGEYYHNPHRAGSAAARPSPGLTRGDMIREARLQADAEALPLRDIRFVTDAYGPAMTVQIGGDIWLHDGRRFEPTEPPRPEDDDLSPCP